MINTDYSSMYNPYLAKAQADARKAQKTAQDKWKAGAAANAADPRTTKAKKTDKSDATDQSSATASRKTSDAAKAGAGEVTQEDFRKLYAKLQGLDYGDYDETDSYRSMANTFLNQMVFSPLSSSKELFVPSMSRGMLSAMFDAAYDTSKTLERIRENYDLMQDDDTADKAADEK